jgi:hypothetical protein
MMDLPSIQANGAEYIPAFLTSLAIGLLIGLERERSKSERIKTLAEVRTTRIEKAAEAKRAALAARKPASENTPPVKTDKAEATTEEKANA